MKKKVKQSRDVSYSKSYKLIEKHGIEALEELWKTHGMCESARILETSKWVVRHLAVKYGWKRPAEKVPHLVKAVKAGRADASTYKHLDWSNVDLSNKNNNKTEESND
jgi:hypothetical protein